MNDWVMFSGNFKSARLSLVCLWIGLSFFALGHNFQNQLLIDFCKKKKKSCQELKDWKGLKCR